MRLTKEQRRNVIMTAAVKAANEFGLFEFTRQQVADAAALKTSNETVKIYWPAIATMREDVAKHPSASDEVRAAAAAVGMSISE